MTATLHVLDVGNLLNAAKQLREIADAIDRGDYGDVFEGALVLAGGELEVFGIGAADAPASHLLLARGMRRLEQP